MLHLLEHFVDIMFIVSNLLHLKIIQNSLSGNDAEVHYQIEPHQDITNLWKLMYTHSAIGKRKMLGLIERVICQQHPYMVKEELSRKVLNLIDQIGKLATSKLQTIQTKFSIFYNKNFDRKKVQTLWRKNKHCLLASI